MELKTLKDLIWDEEKIHKDMSRRMKGLETGERFPSSKHIDADEIKQEAIKWIKTLEAGEYMDFNGKEYEPNSMEFLMLRKFFNITEEDLI